VNILFFFLLLLRLCWFATTYFFLWKEHVASNAMGLYRTATYRIVTFVNGIGNVTGTGVQTFAGGTLTYAFNEMSTTLVLRRTSALRTASSPVSAELAI
jgi:hypothetical protein